MSLAVRLEAASQSHGVIYKGGDGRTVTVRANGADIFLGAIVTAYGETDPDVDLCATGEPISGVIIGEALPYEVDLSKDADSPYADNTYLQMYIPEPGDQLFLTSKTNSTITKNGFIAEDGGFIINGTEANHFGISKETITALSGTQYITLVEWGKH